MSATIPQLIINSPYEEPAEHWRYDRETRSFSRVRGRRPAAHLRLLMDAPRAVRGARGDKCGVATASAFLAVGLYSDPARHDLSLSPVPQARQTAPRLRHPPFFVSDLNFRVADNPGVEPLHSTLRR